eukprot:Colp12_sorted_trinity150504_noHs@17537
MACRLQKYAAILLLAALAVRGEVYLGRLVELEHNVKGEVYIVDRHTIRFEHFYYDGNGPAGYFWAGKGPAPSASGFKIPSTENCLMSRPRRFEDETVILELPDGVEFSDIDYIGMYCIDFDANFGFFNFATRRDELLALPIRTTGFSCRKNLAGEGTSTTTPVASTTPSTTGKDPLYLGNLQNAKHQVSGRVRVVDDATIRIESFSFDGAEQAHFWASRGSSHGPDGFRLSPVDLCMPSLLRRYDNENITLELPLGVSILVSDLWLCIY